MAVDKWKLFESARERWPRSFRITPTDGEPCFRAEPDLVDVYRTIEASCEPTGDWTPTDEWTQLAIWSFHQALWKLAEEAAEGGGICREDVTFEMFDEWMGFNLSDDCWSAERQEYEASPSRFH